jgi:YHS domain-containing protein
MLTILIAIVASSGTWPPLCCPSSHFAVKKPAVIVEYGGALFGTCCDTCDEAFVKDPKDAMARAIRMEATIGAFQYDPITGLRIHGEKAATISDCRGIRYFFMSEKEKQTFDVDPTKYVTAVKSEAYFCPVSKQETLPTTAGAYADYNGTRYFLRDGESLKRFKANPTKYAPNAASAVKDVIPVRLTK